MNAAYWIAFFSAALLLALFLFWQSDANIPLNKDIHLGSWTCESGAPGNRLRFWYDDSERPESLLNAVIGRVQVEGLFGLEGAEGEWNFGYWEPLILNIHFGDTYGYVAVKKIDHDHLVLRYTQDCDELIAAPFDHPDVLHFLRVTETIE